MGVDGLGVAERATAAAEKVEEAWVVVETVAAELVAADKARGVAGRVKGEAGTVVELTAGESMAVEWWVVAVEAAAAWVEGLGRD